MQETCRAIRYQLVHHTGAWNAVEEYESLLSLSIQDQLKMGQYRRGPSGAGRPSIMGKQVSHNNSKASRRCDAFKKESESLGIELRP